MWVGKIGYNWNRPCVDNAFEPIAEKFSPKIIPLEPLDPPPPIWPPLRRLAVQTDFLISLTCICFVPIFQICILPISFFWFVQCNFWSNIVNVMALLITAFSLFVRLGFAMFVVDFAHKLHFQVRLVKDECHAVAHHNLVIQASRNFHHSW